MNINKINFYHSAFEITKEQYNDIDFVGGRGTLSVGKGKSKRFFISLFSRQGHSAAMEIHTEQKGCKGQFFIIHHLGKNPCEIVKEFEIK